MSDNKTTVNFAPGLVPILTGLFAAGKIFGYLDWSWWWVFSPLWIAAGLWLGVMAIILFLGVLVVLVK